MSNKKQSLIEKYPALKVLLAVVVILGFVFASEEVRTQAILKYIGAVILIGAVFLVKKIMFDYKVKKADTIKSEDCKNIKDELEKKIDITGIVYKGAMASHDSLKDILDYKYTKAVMGILIVAQSENKAVAREKYKSLIKLALDETDNKDELIKNIGIYNDTLVEAKILDEQQAKEIMDGLNPVQTKPVEEDEQIIETKQPKEVKPVKKTVEIKKIDKKPVRKEVVKNEIKRAVEVQPVQARFCRFCGSKLNDGASFCHKCGKKIKL